MTSLRRAEESAGEGVRLTTYATATAALEQAGPADHERSRSRSRSRSRIEAGVHLQFVASPRPWACQRHPPRSFGPSRPKRLKRSNQRRTVLWLHLNSPRRRALAAGPSSARPSVPAAPDRAAPCVLATAEARPVARSRHGSAVPAVAGTVPALAPREPARAGPTCGRVAASSRTRPRPRRRCRPRAPPRCFHLRPHVLLPELDRVFVTFQRATGRALPGPAVAVQQPPHSRDRATDLELAADQRSDAFQCPPLVFPAMRGRPFGQLLFQQGEPFVRQLRQFRRSLRLQTLDTAFTPVAAPLLHRTLAHPQVFGDVRSPVTSCEPLPASSRIPSRAARRSAVRPPPSAYRITPEYLRDHPTPPPESNPKRSVMGSEGRPERTFRARAESRNKPGHESPAVAWTGPKTTMTSPWLMLVGGNPPSAAKTAAQPRWRAHCPTAPCLSRVAIQCLSSP